VSILFVVIFVVFFTTKRYIIYGMSKRLNLNKTYEPKRCWVGETHKVCYDTREEAEVAARVAEHDHGAPNLSVYKCEFGDHWHLSSS